MVPSTRKISSSGGISEVTTRSARVKPRRERASSGSAGVAEGRNRATPPMNSAYSAVSARPGMKAPAYMSPTERPSWSAMTISTRLGGIICASVPEAAMTPAATRRS